MLTVLPPLSPLAETPWCRPPAIAATTTTSAPSSSSTTTTTTPTSSIDAGWYPHLIDLVIDHVNHAPSSPLSLSLRQVCRVWRHRIDAALEAHHVAVVRTPGGTGGVDVMTVPRFAEVAYCHPAVPPALLLALSDGGDSEKLGLEAGVARLLSFARVLDVSLSVPAGTVSSVLAAAGTQPDVLRLHANLCSSGAIPIPATTARTLVLAHDHFSEPVAEPSSQPGTPTSEVFAPSSVTKVVINVPPASIPDALLLATARLRHTPPGIEVVLFFSAEWRRTLLRARRREARRKFREGLVLAMRKSSGRGVTVVGLTTPEDVGTDLEDEDEDDDDDDDDDNDGQEEGNDEGCSASGAGEAGDDHLWQPRPRPTFVSTEAYRARVGEERYCLETMTPARRPDWWAACMRVYDCGDSDSTDDSSSSSSSSSDDHEDDE